VHDQAAAGDVGGAGQSNGVELKLMEATAVGIGFQAGQVTRVVGSVAVVAMGCARWVEVAAGTHAVATGAVALFMHMKAVLGTRLQPVDRGR
jgi:hypothetical protein